MPQSLRLAARAAPLSRCLPGLGLPPAPPPPPGAPPSRRRRRPCPPGLGRDAGARPRRLPLRAPLPRGPAPAARAAGGGPGPLRAGVEVELWAHPDGARGRSRADRASAAPGGRLPRPLPPLLLEGLPGLPRARLRAAHCGGRGVAAAAPAAGAAAVAAAGGRGLRGAGGRRGGRPAAAAAAPARPAPPAPRPRPRHRVLQVRFGRYLLRPLRLPPGLPGAGGARGHRSLHPLHQHHVRHHAAHHGHAQAPPPPLPQALADLLRGLGLPLRLCQGSHRPARGRGGRAEGRSGRDVSHRPPGPGEGPHEGHLRQRHRAAAGRGGHDLQHPLVEPVRAGAAPRGAGGSAPGAGGGAGHRLRPLGHRPGQCPPAEGCGEGDPEALPRHPRQRPRRPRPRHPRGRLPGAPQDPRHPLSLRRLARWPPLPGARRLPPRALAAGGGRPPPLRLPALRRRQAQLRRAPPGRAGASPGAGADPPALRGAAGARWRPCPPHDPHPARPRGHHQPPVPQPVRGDPRGTWR